MTSTFRNWKNIVEALRTVKIKGMHPAQRRHFLGLDVRILLACILALGLVASVTPVRAQTHDTITNITQLTHALSRGKQLIANLELDATVFACDTNTGALILQDSSGVELLEMDDLKDDLQPGDKIHIDAKPSLLSVGEFGVFVTASPYLDDDGVHGRQMVSRARYFEAGRHPVRLDWFNQRLGIGSGRIVRCLRLRIEFFHSDKAGNESPSRSARGVLPGAVVKAAEFSNASAFEGRKRDQFRS